MIKKFLLLLVIVLAGLCAYAASLPDDYAIDRTLTIKAAPEKIFAQLNDFHAWEAWSPWIKLDPNAKTTFEGPKSGTGAKMRWDGNNQIGTGSMTISESHPSHHIAYQLVFEKPMPGEALSEFTLVPQKEGTRVTWSMSGKRDFLGKLIGVLVNCDKMIGDKYEEGLANLKTVVKG